MGDRRISFMPVFGEVSNPESPTFLLIEFSADALPDFASFADAMAPFEVWAPLLDAWAPLGEVVPRSVRNDRISSPARRDLVM